VNETTRTQPSTPKALDTRPRITGASGGAVDEPSAGTGGYRSESGCGCACCAPSAGNEAANLIGGLGAYANPVLHAVQVKAQLFFTAAGYRVVEPDSLDEATVPARRPICHVDVIERMLLGAVACQTNRYHEPALLGKAA